MDTPFTIDTLPLLHGADYNPEQWLARPDILEQDIALMKKAHVNCVAMGMFSWVSLEPEEGVYTFDWLEAVIDRLHQNGIYTILSTPSGSRPAWMAKAYPEVLRVDPHLLRNRMGARHNHCYTSPVYREKVRLMNTQLARRFGRHPGVVLWHISNEYDGACYCELCQAEFRRWLHDRYGGLDALNQAWWTAFWSHTYTDWQQVEAPGPRGETGVQGLNLDWRRFVTARTVDFCAHEIAAIRAAGSTLPATTNMMRWRNGMDYFKFLPHLDILSWDSYPEWHPADGDSVTAAVEMASFHDFMRSAKGRPFMLMESTPSTVNWREVSKLKRPHVHMLASMQAVAHGADSVQYFQWRKSRGSNEKFHGAVVSHDGRDDTRVFADVAAVGARLAALPGLKGAMPRPGVAMLFDWENRWALADTWGPRKGGMGYEDTFQQHYRALWQLGLAVDIIDSAVTPEQLGRYALVAAPMLYLQRAGIEDKLRDYVSAGGTLVSGCFSGMVNESDLCHLGDVPHGLTEVFGLRVEETDALYDGEHNSMTWNGTAYRLQRLCDLAHPTTAKVLAQYQSDFYAGRGAMFEHHYGSGLAVYLASCGDYRLYTDLYGHLAGRLALPRALEGDLPIGVTATARAGVGGEYIFVQNFNAVPATVPLHRPAADVETGERLDTRLDLPAYGVRILRHL